METLLTGRVVGGWVEWVLWPLDLEIFDGLGDVGGGKGGGGE